MIQVQNNSEWPELSIGGISYKGNSMFEKLQYHDMLLKVVKHETPLITVAVLGAGTFYFQAFLNLKEWEKKTVYEIHPEVREFCESQRYANSWEWVMGDWKKTLSGKYDLLVYDCDEDFVDRELLKKHVSEKGLLLEYKPSGNNS